MQSRIHSLLESLANMAIGYVIALASQLAIFPLFDIHVAFHDNLLIGAWFTAISLARSYVVRRWFTRRTECPPADRTDAAMASLRALVSLKTSPNSQQMDSPAWEQEWVKAARLIERA